MTAIERTAYPRLKITTYRKVDLDRYLPTRAELQYMEQQQIRSDTMKLNFMLQLKTFVNA